MNTMLALVIALSVAGCATPINQASSMSLDTITAAHDAMIHQAAAAIQRAKDWANIEAAANEMDAAKAKK